MDARIKFRSSAGFSLLELLVVTVVIGILMGMATSAVLWATDRARQAATIADMRNLAAAITAYSVDHVGYPRGNGAFMAITSHLRSYVYNSRVPESDHWLHRYAYLGTSEGYSLTSFGKDGVDGFDLTWEDRFEFERDIVLVNGRFEFETAGNKKGNNGKTLGKDHGTGKPDGVPGGGN